MTEPDMLQPQEEADSSPSDESPVDPSNEAEGVSKQRGSGLFEYAFVAACCLVVAAGLRLDLVFTDSFPLGTDLTGHVVVPWFDRSHLLGFLPGSWSNDMFNGFPINQLYPWLPSWLMAVMSFVMPLAVSVKLLTVLPLIALPAAIWRASRWATVPPALACGLAAASLPFLYETNCGSCGGNVTSTLNGEYSFAWGMLFAVLALGSIDRLARSGRGPIASALLVVATAFSHPLPTLWLGVGAVILGISHEVWADRRRGIPFLVSAGLAALTSLLWWLPFIANRSWVPVNPLVRDGSALEWLFPASLGWEIAVTVLTLLGAIWAVRTRQWFLIAIGLLSMLAVAVFFRFTDGGPFYSPRVLPFWQFGRWMLAGVGFAWLLSVALTRIKTDRSREPDPRYAPVVWLAISGIVIGTTWGWWGVVTPPTGTTDGKASVLGLDVPVASAAAFEPLLAGFAARSDYPELQSVQDLINAVGKQYGCGTLMWDAGDPATDGPLFGDSQVFWQSAMWTDGCVPAADGVLVDSSMTAPGMAMTKSLVSQSIEPLLPLRPQFRLNLDVGASRMQAMGVRYYLTHGGPPAEQAQANKLLKLVASGGRWQMWEVSKGVQVASLTSTPAVFDPPAGNTEWEAIGNKYFVTSTYATIPLAQTGPDDWERLAYGTLPQNRSTPAAAVTDVKVTEDTVSFSVKTVGTPVVVRASSFPGWRVEGAEGPYRVTANYSVVIPTTTTVTMIKGRTVIDWLAIAAGALGLLLLASYGLYRRLHHDGEPIEPDDPAVKQD